MINAFSHLFLIGVICLLPFNALPYFQELLREMGSEGAFYPSMGLLFICVITIIRKGKVFFPTHRSIQFLLGLFLWIILSSVVNSSDILAVSFKGRSGIEKNVFQIIFLLLVMIITYVIYYAIKINNISLVVIRRYFFYSYLLVCANSIIELAFLGGSDIARVVLLAMHDWIRQPEIPALAFQIRSFSAEASWFASYCSLLFPWIFSYIFTERKKGIYYLAAMYLVLLIVLTWSRTAYIITMLQVFVYSVLLIRFRSKGTIVQLSRIYVGLFLIIGIGITMFSGTVSRYESILDVLSSIVSSDNLSNIARMGSQFAAINMGFSNPVFGVGFGQYGFYADQYMPSWALVSPEIQEWLSDVVSSKWPPVHGLHTRIFAETGIIGLILWLMIWISVLYTCYQSSIRTHKVEEKIDIYGITLFVSILGVFMSGFNVDSLKFFGYWLMLAIAWYHLKR